MDGIIQGEIWAVMIEEKADAEVLHVGYRLLVLGVDSCQIVVKDTSAGCWMGYRLIGRSLPRREKIMR